ncbi:FAST kinase domain-containing protein 1, mitochondrial isoform X1 [Dendroctonus ponderosae]|uniref:FAST kinase domain-containing protein 1, mitochondrial isoform X1 n=1 Tax=Dendroctonus ponderosae TaxID=77166 RepID=UPI002036613A|nr:FAST kinase domain-containing protein 1, mitochondrial isoform X1 [Dendroctonus ponderosae]XP_048526078.1 FAST kinase domain-containing protein 1, mitochondrial isoform X1 [Dendroctonus ponderosae]KAH1026677.1 hypothetical protein HUJ05_000308 [Dendroctonus ponderosae]
MSFLKNVCRKYQVYNYFNRTVLGKRHLNTVVPSGGCRCRSVVRLTKRGLFLNEKRAFDSTSIPEVDEITGIYPYTDDKGLNQSDLTRKILFQDNPDGKSLEISKCASVEDVFKFVRTNNGALDYKYLSQIVLALYDLQTIFIYQYEKDEDASREIFFKKLLEHKELYMVFDAIKNNLASFEPQFLSYTVMHLNKLGLSVENGLIQAIALQLKDHLLRDFSLSIASRLFRVIFLENSIRPFYIAQDLIPHVLRHIELVNSTKDLEDLNMCLLKLNAILTTDVLQRYEAKVRELIEARVLTGDDYRLILKMLSVFNLAMWRNKHSSIISKCILLMKGSIDKLNLHEMYHLYDVFFKNQEPGDVLNTIQRAAARLLQEIDEAEEDHSNKLKLFSSVIYFSSPMNKAQFRRDIAKYMNETEDFNNLITLRKIFSFLKVSDPKLCDLYWNKACQVMKKEKDFAKIMEIVNNYVYFCGDIPGFRHYAFEHHVSTVIEKAFKAGTLTLFPNNFFSAFAFILLSSYNEKLFNSLLLAFNEMHTQMAPMHVFKLSNGLLMGSLRKSTVSSVSIDTIHQKLHQQTVQLHSRLQEDIVASALLIKGAILRKETENQLFDDMMSTLARTKHMSSKVMEHICFILFCTKSLIPEVLNLCTNYIIEYKENIVGFNVEKILHMLYQLNYEPVYEKEFFETVINIFIRDQDRMSGLSFLQGALSLCFFQQMPKSFVKQIFNVEFLDKLDVELANCYFRDKYPNRVRRVLMQLNRAVCLEYPEYNVPWFHQKYIEEYQKTNAIDDVVKPIHLSVKSYLQGVLGEENIRENVTLPYGYEVNFVYHLDRQKKPTMDLNGFNTTKYAILIKPMNAFTRLYVRLKGEHALQNRHLEMLGYKVKIIRWSEWENLLYAKERVDYIEQLVFS